jgi:AcrR family transcriptional regulator
MSPKAPTRKRKSSPTAPHPGRSGSGALREQARELYREGILEAAAEILAERGFAGTRMQDVAARAGLSTGTLYNYFTSKAEVTVSLLEHRAQQLVVRLDELLATIEPGASVIDGLIRVTLEHLDRHRSLFSLLEQGALTALGPAESRCHSMRRIYFGAILATLQAAETRGELRPGLPLEDLVVLLGGMFQALGRSMLAAGVDAPLVDRAPLVRDVFLNGVGRT